MWPRWDSPPEGQPRIIVTDTQCSRQVSESKSISSAYRLLSQAVRVSFSVIPLGYHHELFQGGLQNRRA